MKKLDEYRVLVLNADYQPLSFFPLSTLNWKDAIRAKISGRVIIVDEYEEDDAIVHSPSMEIRLPKTIALKKFRQPKLYPAFSKASVFLRDDYSCQYCGSKKDLTFDHVKPRKKGGKTTWENVATACYGCNSYKGSSSLKELKMKLINKPYKPTVYELQQKAKKHLKNKPQAKEILHYWADFINFDKI